MIFYQTIKLTSIVLKYLPSKIKIGLIWITVSLLQATALGCRRVCNKCYNITCFPGLILM